MNSNDKRIISIPHRIIRYQDPKLAWHVVGFRGYRIHAMRKDFRKVNGAKWPSFIIEIFFTDFPSFPLAYFRSEETRNVAFNLIKGSPPTTRIDLNYATYFSRIKIPIQTISKSISGYELSKLIDHKNNKLKKAYGIDFLTAWNNSTYTEQKLNKIQLEELKKGIISPELDVSLLKSDLATFMDTPKSAIKKGVDPIIFYSNIVNNQLV